MKSSETVCLTVGLSRTMYKDLIVSLLLKKYVNMFERMEIADYIYEGVVVMS